MQGFYQRGASDDFRIDVLERQEHDGEIGGEGWLHVLVVDVLRHSLDGDFQLPGRAFYQRCIPFFVGIDVLFIHILRELGIDGQIHHILAIVLTGKLDGELHELGGILACLYVGFILLGAEHLFKQGAQLDFTERASRLHVAQHLFQPSHILGQGLHLSQALLHVFQL